MKSPCNDCEANCCKQNWRAELDDDELYLFDGFIIGERYFIVHECPYLEENKCLLHPLNLKPVACQAYECYGNKPTIYDKGNNDEKKI
jgi:hypothetical protein